MKYYTDLFSPETYQAFSNSDRTISGFRKRQKSFVQRLEVGDKLICYVTRISRWFGVLEVISEWFEDDKPYFVGQNDPFVMRVKVKPLVWLPLDQSIPIHEDFIWNELSYTKGLPKNSTHWTGMMRNSLNELKTRDGSFLLKTLIEQSSSTKNYKLNDNDLAKIKRTTVRTHDKEIDVVVPEDDEKVEDEKETPESIRIQATIAKIGERMGHKIWLPRRDKGRVMQHWSPDKEESLLENLPLNYDDTTLKTIENIDVIWIKGRSIVRAFEVEHTTSIYSGILRMADLMALQPNLNIKAHIVAPEERKDKVLDEIRRPVFSLLEKGPLAESCTYLSYDSIKKIANDRSLGHLKDTVLEDYEEIAEEF
ncbi:MAG: EVE domain-containing protein [bacterium]|nr:EVE domain-containing protein [bacterium]